LFDAAKLGIIFEITKENEKKLTGQYNFLTFVHKKRAQDHDPAPSDNNKNNKKLKL
jgi:hypothetical protein